MTTAEHFAALRRLLEDPVQIQNERDIHGDLTDFALAAGALIDAGCDCGTDEPGTCLGCICERALKAERARAITAEQRVFELETKLADAEAKLAKALASATSMVLT